MAKIFNPIEISRSLERTLFEDVGETAFAILRNLVFASPVGDPESWQNPDSAAPGYVGGHFRRNWIVAIRGFKPSGRGGAGGAGDDRGRRWFLGRCHGWGTGGWQAPGAPEAGRRGSRGETVWSAGPESAALDRRSRCSWKQATS